MMDPVLTLRPSEGGVLARVLFGNWVSANNEHPVRLNDPNALAPCVGLRATQDSAFNCKEPRPLKPVRVDIRFCPKAITGDLNLPKGDE